MAREAEELQLLLGRQRRIECYQAPMLRKHLLEGVRNHVLAPCTKLKILIKASQTTTVKWWHLAPRQRIPLAKQVKTTRDSVHSIYVACLSGGYSEIDRRFPAEKMLQMIAICLFDFQFQQRHLTVLKCAPIKAADDTGSGQWV